LFVFKQNIVGKKFEGHCPRIPPLAEALPAVQLCRHPQNISHTHSQNLYLQDSITQKYFHGGLPVNSFKDEGNMARSQALCLH